MYNICMQSTVDGNTLKRKTCSDVVDNIINEFKKTLYYKCCIDPRIVKYEEGRIKLDESSPADAVIPLLRDDEHELRAAAAQQVYSCYQQINSNKFYPTQWVKCNSELVGQLAYMNIFIVEQKVLVLNDYKTAFDKLFNDKVPGLNELLNDLFAK